MNARKAHYIHTNSYEVDPSYDVSIGFSDRLNILLDHLDLSVPTIDRGRKIWVSRTFVVTPTNSNNWLSNDIIPKRDTLTKIADFSYCNLPKSYRPRKAIDVEAWLVYAEAARWRPKFLDL